MIPPLEITTETLNMIRTQMKAQKLNQTELARRTNISRITICRFLKGKTGVRHDRFLRILREISVRLVIECK